jgi:chromosome segregation ATPase
MRVRDLAIASSLLALLLACGENPVAKLQAERNALLDASRPKAEFWSEVERKGTFAKEKRALDVEVAALQPKTVALQAETDLLVAALAQAREVNAQTEAALAGNRTELARLEAEVERRDATLAGFDARRSEAAQP